MNFLHLKYFLMVAEELNITRAAERLYISQQSLSNHISNMERELDVKLFTRSPKLSLTYAGGLLVETATQILDLYSQYQTKVGDINRHYLGMLRVGISHTCGLALMPDILPKFRQEFPFGGIFSFEGNSTQLEERAVPRPSGPDYLLSAHHDGWCANRTSDGAKISHGGAQSLHRRVIWRASGGGPGPVCTGSGYRSVPAGAFYPH